MGIKVSAAEAGALVGRHERQVRWHIQVRRDLPARKSRQGRWEIDTDDLARVPGWVVDRERLAKLELRQTRTAGGIVARIEALEARARSLEALVGALEGQLEQLRRRLMQSRDADRADLPDLPDLPEPPEDDTDTGGPLMPPTSPRPPMNHFAGVNAMVAEFPAVYRGPSTVALMDRGPEQPRSFRSRADAARWLERHGVNEHTPKTWSGWRYVTLEPISVLSFALALQRNAQARGDWRVSWRLRRCTDSACVCHELLDGSDDGSDGAA